MTKQVKLFFYLPSDNIAGAEAESLWSEPTPHKSLVVMNIPFYAKGISFLDEVSFSIEKDILVFKGIIKKSKHSTYRILQLQKDQKDKFDEYWKPLKKLGCSFESKLNGATLYAIDVPPEVDIKKVYELLEKGENDKIWHFEEGDYGYAQ